MDDSPVWYKFSKGILVIMLSRECHVPSNKALKELDKVIKQHKYDEITSESVIKIYEATVKRLAKE